MSITDEFFAHSSCNFSNYLQTALHLAVANGDEAIVDVLSRFVKNSDLILKCPKLIRDNSKFIKISYFKYLYDFRRGADPCKPSATGDSGIHMAVIF